MAEVIRAGKEWKEKIIEFADLVFGQQVQPGGFAALIPRVYGPEASCEDNHFLVLEDGVIQALLLTEPTTLICGETEVRGIGVGTVSVSRESRGKGYMQLLLKTVREWMQEQDYAFAVLGGQRQRYAYWGYEPSGIRFKARISQPNVKHALGEEMTGGIEKQLTLEPMKEGTAEADRSWELYNAQEVRFLRARETFAAHLAANRHQPYVLYQNGMYAGYLSVSVRKDHLVLTELVLTDEEIFPAVLRFLMKAELQGGMLSAGMPDLKKPEAAADRCAVQEIELTLPLYQQERISYVERFAESCWLSGDHQYYIADLASVLAYSMQVKQKTCGLRDGEWTFRTEKGTYCCSVVRGEGKVSFTALGEIDQEKEEEEKEEIRSEAEMTRLLFGPSFAAAWNLTEVPAGWLPFPLCLTEIDAV